MTPIERAARALAREHWDVQDLHGGTNKSSSQWVDERWRDYLPNARAVIAAIRDPSDEMIADGKDRMNVDPELGHHEATPESIWSTMIDALLEEG